eukprot:scaffold1375_cov137-Cylindrotheca_fusiformis.AAC.7
MSISVMTILTTLSAILLLLQAYEDADVNDDVSSLGTLLCAWSLTSLLFFHAMIVSDAQTTNEKVRNVYRVGSVENVADKGCCRNWFSAFCEPWAVSRLPKDMSEIVHCRYEQEETVWDGDAPNAPMEERSTGGNNSKVTKAGADNTAEKEVV